jgi:hypothetical protein
MLWFALTLNFTHLMRACIVHWMMPSHLFWISTCLKAGFPQQAKRGGNTIHVEPIQPYTNIYNQYPTNTEKGISMNQFAQFQ